MGWIYILLEFELPIDIFRLYVMKYYKTLNFKKFEYCKKKV